MPCFLVASLRYAQMDDYYNDGDLQNTPIMALDQLYASGTYDSEDFAPGYDGSADVLGRVDLREVINMGGTPALWSENLKGNPLVAQLKTEETVANINVEGGAVVLASSANTKIFVKDFLLYASGADMGGLTTLDIECDDGVNLYTIPVAALTNGTVVKPSTASVTFGSGTVNGCDEAEGILLGKTGSAGSGATSVLMMLEYVVQPN